MGYITNSERELLKRATFVRDGVPGRYVLQFDGKPIGVVKKSTRTYSPKVPGQRYVYFHKQVSCWRAFTLNGDTDYSRHFDSRNEAAIYLVLGRPDYA